MLLAAEAGGGKTRLVRELAHEAAARGVLVLYGASDAAVSTPYQPLREWLEFLLRVCDPDALAECLGDRGETLARLVPELARLTGPPAPPGEPEADRYLLQSAAAELLRRLSRAPAAAARRRRRPLGRRRDAAAAPPSGADGSGGAAARPRRLPRPRRGDRRPRFSDTLADLSRLDGVTRLSLGRLSDEEVGAFIRASTDAEAPGGARRRRSASSPAARRCCSASSGATCARAARVEVSDGGVRAHPAARRAARPGAAPRRRAAAPLAPRPRDGRDARARSRRRAAVRAARARRRRRARPGAPSPPPSTRRSRPGSSRSCPSRRPPAASRTSSCAAPSTTGSPASAAPSSTSASARRSSASTRADPSSRPARARPPLHARRPVAGVERAVDYNLRAADAAIAAAAFDEAAARLSTALELGIADPRERARVQVELGYLLVENPDRERRRAVLGQALETATSLGDRGLAAYARMYLAHPDEEKMVRAPRRPSRRSPSWGTSVVSRSPGTSSCSSVGGPLGTDSTSPSSSGCSSC